MFQESDIVPRLRDNTLRIGVGWFAICIGLRLAFGLSLIYWASDIIAGPGYIKLVVLSLLVVPMLGFLRKYLVVFPVWKSYLKTVLALGCSIILVVLGLINKQEYFIISAGIILIADVLMGVMSRHLVEVLAI